MINTILYYLLVGTIVGFFLEKAVVATGNHLSLLERASVIILWPIMLAIFIFYFFKGMSDE
jgi:hypothetical protein